MARPLPSFHLPETSSYTHARLIKWVMRKAPRFGWASSLMRCRFWASLCTTQIRSTDGLCDYLKKKRQNSNPTNDFDEENSSAKEEEDEVEETGRSLGYQFEIRLFLKRYCRNRKKRQIVPYYFINRKHRTSVYGSGQCNYVHVAGALQDTRVSPCDSKEEIPFVPGLSLTTRS